MATVKKNTKKKVDNVKEVWIELSDTTKIRVEVTEFKGVHRVDVREHIDTEKYVGFTKKGVNLRTEKLEELISALQTIKATIEAEGLINEDEGEGE